jgi:O-acetyl-ADP-ribose deacetylase (regulator of RNase III)
MRADQIHLVKGDITEFDGDAITNAANGYLLNGAGVAGAISRGAGYAFNEVCELTPTLPPGAVIVTGGYQLPAKFVVHCVTMQGPGERTEPLAVRECTIGALKAADALKCVSLAFCLFGTGIGGFDVRRACDIEIVEILRYVPDHLQEVTVYAYDTTALTAAKKSFETWTLQSRRAAAA